jgi:DNA-directed RNA polymerase specialized sigma24 family protein
MIAILSRFLGFYIFRWYNGPNQATMRIGKPAQYSEEKRVLVSSMYVHDPSMVNSLNGLVTRLTWNRCLQQDLLQEALIHLWLIETRWSGQTTSWYLQSCRFHLQHYLSSGRSVDSAKRRSCQVELEGDETEEILTSEAEELVFSEVSARDLVNLLSRHLSNDERAVLGCLTEGLGPREIGRRLKMSHTMAVRHRCKIAEVLNRLDKHGAGQWQTLARNCRVVLDGRV